MSCWQWFVLCLGYLYLAEVAIVALVVARELVRECRRSRALSRALIAYIEGAASREAEIDWLERHIAGTGTAEGRKTWA